MEIKQEGRRPVKDEIYRHFKGNFYKIITLARDCDTGEEVVVYQALYGDYGIYVRPLFAFVEVLDKNRYPKAEQIHRFEPVEEEGKDISESAQPQAAAEPEPIRPQTAGEVTEEEEVPKLDPLLEAFLEADTYRERLNALRGVEHRITDEMINTMAVVLDLEIPEGPIDQRYRDLENSILTRERFECTRLT